MFVSSKFFPFTSEVLEQAWGWLLTQCVPHSNKTI